MQTSWHGHSALGFEESSSCQNQNPTPSCLKFAKSQPCLPEFHVPGSLIWIYYVSVLLAMYTLLAKHSGQLRTGTFFLPVHAAHQNWHKIFTATSNHSQLWLGLRRAWASPTLVSRTLWASVSKQCTALTYISKALHYSIDCYVAKAFTSEVSDHSTQAIHTWQVAKTSL